MDLVILDYALMARRYYIKTLNDLDYEDYLQTRHWRCKRLAKLRQAYYRCEQCRYQYSLDVHHLTYENRGCEPLTDLQVLCRRCHQREYEEVGC